MWALNSLWKPRAVLIRLTKFLSDHLLSSNINGTIIHSRFSKKDACILYQLNECVHNKDRDQDEEI